MLQLVNLFLSFLLPLIKSSRNLWYFHNHANTCTQIELECTCNVPEVYIQCGLNIGCISFDVWAAMEGLTFGRGLTSQFIQYMYLNWYINGSAYLPYPTIFQTFTPISNVLCIGTQENVVPSTPRHGIHVCTWFFVLEVFLFIFASIDSSCFTQLLSTGMFCSLKHQIQIDLKHSSINFFFIKTFSLC